MTKKLRGSTNLCRATPRPAATGRILAIGQGTEISLVVLDLSRLVVGMRKELRDLLREDISFDISLSATGRCLVSADRHQMRELVIHLALDARDAMPHGGSLDIAIEKKKIDESMSLYRDSTVEHVVAVRSRPGGAPDMAERGFWRVGARSKPGSQLRRHQQRAAHWRSRRAGETLVKSICRDRRDPPSSFRQRVAVVRR
jgi:signal transduction histidine kinase